MQASAEKYIPSEGLIITLLGGVSALIISCCMCVLKSRCVKIKCCGVEIERNVLQANELNLAEINVPNIRSTS